MESDSVLSESQARLQNLEKSKNSCGLSLSEAESNKPTSHSLKSDDIIMASHTVDGQQLSSHYKEENLSAPPDSEDKLSAPQCKEKVSPSAYKEKLGPSQRKLKLATPQRKLKLVTPHRKLKLVTPQCKQKLVTPQCKQKLVTPQCKKDLSAQKCENDFLPPQCKEKLATSQGKLEPSVCQHKEKLSPPQCNDELSSPQYKLTTQCKEKPTWCKEGPSTQCKEKPSAHQYEDGLATPQYKEESVNLCKDKLSLPQCKEELATQQYKNELSPTHKERLSAPQCTEEISLPRYKEELSTPHCKEKQSPPQCNEELPASQCIEGQFPLQYKEELSHTQCKEELSITQCKEKLSAPLCENDKLMPCSEDGKQSISYWKDKKSLAPHCVESTTVALYKKKDVQNSPKAQPHYKESSSNIICQEMDVAELYEASIETVENKTEASCLKNLEIIPIGDDTRGVLLKTSDEKINDSVVPVKQPSSVTDLKENEYQDNIANASGKECVSTDGICCIMSADIILEGGNCDHPPKSPSLKKEQENKHYDQELESKDKSVSVLLGDKSCTKAVTDDNILSQNERSICEKSETFTPVAMDSKSSQLHHSSHDNLKKMETICQVISDKASRNSGIKATVDVSDISANKLLESVAEKPSGESRTRSITDNTEPICFESLPQERSIMVSDHESNVKSTDSCHLSDTEVFSIKEILTKDTDPHTKDNDGTVSCIVSSSLQINVFGKQANGIPVQSFDTDSVAVGRTDPMSRDSVATDDNQLSLLTGDKSLSGVEGNTLSEFNENTCTVNRRESNQSIVDLGENGMQKDTTDNSCTKSHKTNDYNLIIHENKSVTDISKNTVKKDGLQNDTPVEGNDAKSELFLNTFHPGSSKLGLLGLENMTVSPDEAKADTLSNYCCNENTCKTKGQTAEDNNHEQQAEIKVKDCDIRMKSVEEVSDCLGNPACSSMLDENPKQNKITESVNTLVEDSESDNASLLLGNSNSTLVVSKPASISGDIDPVEPSSSLETVMSSSYDVQDDSKIKQNDDSHCLSLVTDDKENISIASKPAFETNSICENITGTRDNLSSVLVSLEPKTDAKLSENAESNSSFKHDNESNGSNNDCDNDMKSESNTDHSDNTNDRSESSDHYNNGSDNIYDSPSSWPVSNDDSRNETSDEKGKLNSTDTYSGSSTEVKVSDTVADDDCATATLRSNERRSTVMPDSCGESAITLSRNNNMTDEQLIKAKETTESDSSTTSALQDGDDNNQNPTTVLSKKQESTSEPQGSSVNYKPSDTMPKSINIKQESTSEPQESTVNDRPSETVPKLEIYHNKFSASRCSLSESNLNLTGSLQDEEACDTKLCLTDNRQNEGVSETLQERHSLIDNLSISNTDCAALSKNDVSITDIKTEDEELENQSPEGVNISTGRRRDQVVTQCRTKEEKHLDTQCHIKEEKDFDTQCHIKEEKDLDTQCHIKEEKDLDTQCRIKEEKNIPTDKLGVENKSEIVVGVDSFDWDVYLEDAEAAPPTAFWHIERSLETGITEGQFLEVLSEEVCNTASTVVGRESDKVVTDSKKHVSYWTAKVLSSCGLLLRLRYEGIKNEKGMNLEFWVDLSGSYHNLKPVGWSQSHGIPRKLPANISTWRGKSVEETKQDYVPSVPKDTFEHSHCEIFARIQEGDFLELIDDKNPFEGWVAVVKQNYGGLLVLQYVHPAEDWSPFWIFFLDSRVKPLRWIKKQGDPYRYKYPDHLSGIEENMKSVSITRTINLESFLLSLQKEQSRHCLSDGMYVEAVLPSTFETIHVASVSRVLDDVYFELDIDGYKWITTIDDPLILPINFCKENNIKLFPPKEIVEKDLEWDKFLAAKSCTYLTSKMVPVRTSVKDLGFEVGHKLEAAHPLQREKIFIATVTKITKHLLWIRLDSEAKDQMIFCRAATSSQIFPTGWSLSHQLPLYVPGSLHSGSEGNSCRNDEFIQKDHCNVTSSTEASGSLCLEPDMIKSEMGESQSSLWCERLYTNHWCYPGPYLSRSKVAKLSRSVGPGPVHLVLEEVLGRTINAGYIPTRVLREMQSMSKENPSWRPTPVKAKYKRHTLKATVHIASTSKDVDTFLMELSKSILCCHNLWSLKHSGEICPYDCNGLNANLGGTLSSVSVRGRGLKGSLSKRKRGNRKRLLCPAKQGGTGDEAERQGDDDDDDYDLDDALSGSEVEGMSRPPSPMLELQRKLKQQKRLLSSLEIHMNEGKLDDSSSGFNLRGGIKKRGADGDELQHQQYPSGGVSDNGESMDQQLEKRPRLDTVQRSNPYCLEPAHVSSDPLEWSVSDVENYILSQPAICHHAVRLREHEVDGRALMLLNLPTLVHYLHLPHSSAVTLAQHICKVKLSHFVLFAAGS